MVTATDHIAVDGVATFGFPFVFFVGYSGSDVVGVQMGALHIWKLFADILSILVVATVLYLLSRKIAGRKKVID